MSKEVFQMRLSKIQGALQSRGIEYSYEEVGDLGRISFTFGGKQYTVNEIKGNHDKLVTGIYTNMEGLSRFATQKMITDFILSLK